MKHFKLLALLMSTIFLATEANSQRVNFSLLYPFCTVTDTNAPIAFNFGIAGASAEKLNGVGFSLLTQRMNHGMKGLAFSGMVNQNRGPLKGAMLSGLLNTVKGKTIGIQVAGLGNMGVGSIKGIQVATLVNYALDSLTGLQLSSGYNLVSEGFTGAQLSVLFNINGDDGKGLQFASVSNINLERFSGLQLSLVNFAGQLNGAQIGLVNLARKMGGFQLGLINITNEFEGLHIGLVNISAETEIQLIAGGGNFGTTFTGVRFSTNNFYNILSASSPIIDFQSENSGGVGYRFGFYLTHDKWVTISTDLGFLNMLRYDKTADDYYHAPAFQWRVNAEKSVFKKLGVFISAGYTHWSPAWTGTAFRGKLTAEGGIIVL